MNVLWDQNQLLEVQQKSPSDDFDLIFLKHHHDVKGTCSHDNDTTILKDVLL